MDMLEIVETLLAHACEDVFSAERAGEERAILVARAKHDVLAQAMAIYEQENEEEKED